MVGRKEPARVCALVTAFAEPERTRKLFQVARDFGDLERVPWLLFEDPSLEATHKIYGEIAEEFGVPHLRRPEWGCMQGVFDWAMKSLRGFDWAIYIPDDVLPTPGYVEWVVKWINALPEYVGGLQTPYWNYPDLFPHKSPESMYYPDHEWLKTVRWNPHWYGPCLYMNLNGASFAVSKKAFDAVGGLDLRTWCLDEFLSWKMWTDTEYCIVSIPGPPSIHYGGASTGAQHMLNKAHKRHATIEGWLDAVGKDKEECAHILRGEMAKKAAKYNFQPR